MARLTRQEAQAMTRETLLATAVEHFLDRGYAAASLDQIAEDAGYSKGAVYSNFKNKDELCAEVLGRIRLTKVGEITSQLGANSTLDDAVAEFARWAERTIGDKRWTLLEVEFSVRSRHSEEIREKIATGADQVRGLIAGVVQHLAESNGVTPALDRTPRHCAYSASESVWGYSVRSAELPVDPLVDTLREILLGG